MARLWTSGFEQNWVGTNTEFFRTSGSPAVQSTTVRSGTYALQITGFSSGTSEGVAQDYHGTSTDGPIYTRAYFRYATLPSAENAIISFGDTSSNFSVVAIRVTIDDTGVLRLYDEDGVIGSPSAALSANTWYRIEVMYDKTGGAAADIVRAKLDGTEFAGATDRTITTTTGRYRVGGNLSQEAQTTGDWFFDDLAINDNTGSFQNSYPGEGEVIHIKPNAVGDFSDWTGSAAGDDYAMIDEETPNDLGDYISESITDDITDVELAATPAALESTDEINCVQVGVRFRAGAGTTETFVLRIKDASGGTVEESSDITCSTSGWNTNTVSLPKNYPLTLYDLPGASTTAWTKATLDTAQIGVRNTGGAGVANVTALWLVIDHKPSGGTSVSVNADLVTATTSAQAPTTTTIRNNSVTADLVTTPSSLPSPTVTATQNDSVTADLVNTTLSLTAPTVTTAQNVTVSADLITNSLSTQSPTTTTTQNESVTTDVITSTLSVQAPTITAIQNESVAADVITMTASLPSPTVSTGFQYYKTLTPASGFSGSSHPDFPARIILASDSDLNTHVTNASGYDIAFFSDSALTTQIPHELISYSAGTLVADFKVGTFTSSSTIYMAYGNSAITTDQSDTATWSSDYKLVIHGKAASDSTTNAQSITNSGVAVGATGKMHQSLDFESAEGDYLEVAHHASLNITGAYTFSAWVNFESNGGNLGGLWYKSSTSMWEGANLKTHNLGHNGGAWFSNHAKDLNNWQYGQKTHSPSNGTWYYIVGTWDGSATSSTAVKVYLDGTVSAETGGIAGTPDVTQTNTESARIGGKAKSGTDYLWDGKIEEFRVLAANRSADWIATEYAMQNDNATFWSVSAEQEVGASTSVTVNAGVVTTALSTQAPTITAVRNVTVAADLITNTTSTQPPTLSVAQNATPAADVLTGTLATLAPTVTTVRQATMSADLVTLTASVQTPTITTVRNTTINADVVSTTASIQTPNLTVIQNASINADLLTGTLSIPAPTLTTIRNVTLNADAITSTISTQAPTVDAFQPTHVTVNASVIRLGGEGASKIIDLNGKLGMRISKFIHINI